MDHHILDQSLYSQTVLKYSLDLVNLNVTQLLIG